MKNRTLIGLLVTVVLTAMVGLTGGAAQARTSTSGHGNGTIRTAEGTMSAPVDFRSAQGKFRGTFVPSEFVVEGDQLMAVGVVTGRVDKRGAKKAQVAKAVTLPVMAINGESAPATSVASSAAASDSVSAAAVGCDVLNLVLGPLDLNLLGLQINLNQVVLDIVAVPGALLGDLLCAVANLLSGGLLAGLLGQISDLLNQILAALQL